MNCIEFLPFGQYLIPIQKMAKGGQTHSGQKPDKTYPATLDIHKALTPAYQNWSEEAVFEISQHFDLDANDEAELENALQRAYRKATSPSIVRANRLEEMRVEKGEIDEQMAKGGTTSISKTALADKSDSELQQMLADLRREIDEDIFLIKSFFPRLKAVKAEIARREMGKMDRRDAL